MKDMELKNKQQELQIKELLLDMKELQRGQKEENVKKEEIEKVVMGVLASKAALPAPLNQPCVGASAALPAPVTTEPFVGSCAALPAPAPVTSVINMAALPRFDPPPDDPEGQKRTLPESDTSSYHSSDEEEDEQKKTPLPNPFGIPSVSMAAIEPAPSKSRASPVSGGRSSGTSTNAPPSGSPTFGQEARQPTGDDDAWNRIRTNHRTAGQDTDYQNAVLLMQGGGREKYMKIKAAEQERERKARQDRRGPSPSHEDSSTSLIEFESNT